MHAHPLHSLSPYIRVALDNIISPPWELRERMIFDYELLYVKEGEIEVTIEDAAYRGCPGDFFLFKPRQRHSIRLIGSVPFRQPHLHFDLYYQPDSEDVKVSFNMIEQMTVQEKAWFREDTASYPPMELPNHMRFSNPAYLEKMMFDIIHVFTMKMPFYETEAKGIFVQLWTALLREQHLSRHEPVISHWERLVRIKQYLHQQADRDISLGELAEMTHLSRYHLIRLFKLAFGMTPIQYHQLIRIGKAKELVQYTTESLTQIAEQLGFPNIHSFSRVFKKTDGVAPSFYRKKN
ncbi:AraC family transcriptional regulator [Paenibacillus sp. MSJ-34]|nr:AraC family transcriptional regulator [Paenibacillus sp. MSJ-34]